MPKNKSLDDIVKNVKSKSTSGTAKQSLPDDELLLLLGEEPVKKKDNGGEEQSTPSRPTSEEQSTQYGVGSMAQSVYDPTKDVVEPQRQQAKSVEEITKEALAMKSEDFMSPEEKAVSQAKQQGVEGDLELADVESKAKVVEDVKQRYREEGRGYLVDGIDDKKRKELKQLYLEEAKAEKAKDILYQKMPSGSLVNMVRGFGEGFGEYFKKINQSIDAKTVTPEIAENLLEDIYLRYQAEQEVNPDFTTKDVGKFLGEISPSLLAVIIPSIMSGGASVPMMAAGALEGGTRGSAQGLIDGYIRARSENKSQEEALTIARNQSENQSNIEGLAQASIVLNSPAAKAGQRFMTKLGLNSNAWQKAGRIATEALVVDAPIAGGSQVAINKSLQDQGLDVDLMEGVPATMALGTGIGIIANGMQKVDAIESNPNLTRAEKDAAIDELAVITRQQLDNPPKAPEEPTLKADEANEQMAKKATKAKKDDGQPKEAATPTRPEGEEGSMPKAEPSKKTDKGAEDETVREQPKKATSKEVKSNQEVEPTSSKKEQVENVKPNPDQTKVDATPETKTEVKTTQEPPKQKSQLDQKKIENIKKQEEFEQNQKEVEKSVPKTEVKSRPPSFTEKSVSDPDVKLKLQKNPEMGSDAIKLTKPAFQNKYSGKFKNKQDAGDFYLKARDEAVRQASGNTKYGLVNTAVDRALGFNLAQDVLPSVEKFRRKYFTVSGLLPKEIFKRYNQSTAKIASRIKEMSYNTAELNRAIKKTYPKFSSDVQSDINTALQGGDITKIPEEMRPIVRKMRNHIDALSKEMINEGIVQGDLAVVFDENIGTYTTRSYRLIESPKEWKKYIENKPEGKKIYNKAVNFMRESFNIPEDEAVGRVDAILSKMDTKDIQSLIRGSKLGSKDLGILKKRKDIPVEIRDLMGEYTDPAVNYARSVTKMSHLIEKQKFLEDVSEWGKNKWFFDKPKKGYSSEIAPDGSKTMSPLNGKYTTEEIAEAFRDFNATEKVPNWLRWYMTGVGWVKFSKTVLSLMTHARNLTGNIGFATLNGHVRVNKMSGAVKSTISDFVKSSDEQMQKRFRRYVELGIVDEDARAGELRKIMDESLVNFDDLDKYSENTFKKYKSKGLGFVTDLYKAEDNVWKIYAFENELARYKKAYPELSVEQIEQKSADIIRATYPTYSLVPEGLKSIRRNPLVGSFVSFPAEVLRTSYNTVDLAIKELKSDNKGVRRIGKERLTGILVTSAALPTLGTAVQYMIGISKEEDRAVEEFVAPWTEDTNKIYVSGIEDGKVAFYDLGYSDPHNYIRTPVNILTQNELNNETVGRAVYEFLSPYISQEILTGRIAEVVSNKKPSGGKIYQETDEFGNQVADAYSYIANTIEPATFNNIRRMVKGFKGETGDYGKEYNSLDEIVALTTGQRREVIDIKQSMGFRAYSFDRDMQDAKSIYTRELNKSNPDTNALSRARKVQEDLYNKFMVKVEAMKTLGFKEREILKVLENSNIPKQKRFDLYDKVPYKESAYYITTE